jgi:6-pyruvoyltetrahydropterin/6-carboxytetrahydropterin synthase
VKLVCASFSGLDDVGRVIDFSEIKNRLCTWLDENWDHRFLVWSGDPIASALRLLDDTVVLTSFNPTAENLATYLVRNVAPEQLNGTGVELVACEVQETRKCSAWYTL